MTALQAAWQELPPVAVSLKRISASLGITAPPPAPVARSAGDAIKEAIAAGLPVFEGRPDDPMLQFLD